MVDVVRGRAPPCAPRDAGGASRDERTRSLFRGDYGLRRGGARRGAAADQGNAADPFVLGWAHEETSDHRQAIGAWARGATINPKMVPAHLALADGYLACPNARSRNRRSPGLTANPASPELQAKLAQIQGKS